MIRVNISEAKAHLSRLLRKLRRGERIVLCNRNVPVAEIVPLPPPRTRPRPIGRARGQFEVPASFFDPLPEELMDAFEGKSS
ncbi:MAG: type II toxin-antitoxin system Phd/YefM family antitoxin [Planctomycetota bacterium]